MKEWGIENKVFTIIVDNASSNDLAIRYMKDTIQRSRTLACKGNLFHIRCCAHILNLCIQDGLREIEDIIGKIRKSIEYVNSSEARRVQFAECVQQLQLKDKKLIHDCKTRWNSTFEMLSCALKFKEAFKIFKERDPFYGCCPQEGEWNKAQKICSLLEAFWTATHIISAAMLDPTKKMLAVEFCFPKLYSELDAFKYISKVKETINSLYEEYVVEETNKGAPHLSEFESFGSSSARKSQQSSNAGTKISAAILAIPVSSVASEATFSAGTRVIDSYRSSLSPDTVQTLLCGGDWLRHIHELKKKTKKAKTYQEIVLPIVLLLQYRWYD
ncbi:zinc finger BED domain-containing protein RICESLEEPER 3-like [Zingiber officinale]|uniref:zinc finger BED domain-containing protein RICESLEEPER 3-like n=1 Tax=Zingiber officinale TaxID=94328 RepID=UPI001C4D7A7D|nr:zinc finger BED domain-containing protein RICESLEEPER 3-like [Zingiber officinale]